MTTLLSPSFDVKVNGEARTVFMSFALLNRLTFLLGSPDNVPLVHQNPELREAFMLELLAVRTKGGKVTQQVNLDEAEIDLEQVQELLTWASEHCLDFTIRALQNARKQQERHQVRISDLTNTLIGSVSSNSKTAAA